MEAYNNVLVNRKKRRTAALIVLGITIVALIIVTIISFLGTNMGNYTIRVGDKKGSIQLSEDSGFESSTTFLLADALDNSWLTYADQLPTDEVIDADESGSHNDTEKNTYGAYTFYVRNASDSAIALRNVLGFVEVIKPVNVAVDITEYVRVRLYINKFVEGGPQTHESETFAKRTNLVKTDSEGNVIDQECISRYDKNTYVCSLNSREENNKLATAFYSDNTVLDYMYEDVLPGEVIRYTVVMWLEGYDADTGDVPPEGASIKFELVIDALG